MAQSFIKHFKSSTILCLTVLLASNRSCATPTRSLLHESSCNTLSRILPDRVSLPGSSNYTFQNAEYWDEAAVLSPACISVPQSATEAVLNMALLVENNQSFAMRSGGHTPIPGAAGTNGGVLLAGDNLTDILLTNLNGIPVAKVGSGLRWIEVYEWLANRSLTTIGGRYATVGLGGFSTGGGISYYRSVHGWAADNIMGYEVVTAGGQILLVTAKQYTDLYWALKGGSGNFAYIVHFYLKIWPAVPIYGGNFLTDASSVGTLVNACASFADPEKGGILDPLAAVNPTIQYTLDSRQFSGFTNVFYNASVSDAPAAVKNFTLIPTLGNSTVSGPRAFLDFVAETAVFGNNFRRLFRATSVKSTSGAVHLIQNIFNNQAVKLKNITNGSVTVTYQYMSESFVQAAHVAGNAIDLQPADGSFIAILVASAWQTPEDDAYLLSFLTSLIEAMDSASKGADLYYPFIFLNDAGLGQQPFPFYGGGKSLIKMKQIAKKYDPPGVFQTLAAGAYKL